MRRCLNDIFAYCAGEPELKTVIEVTKYRDVSQGEVEYQEEHFYCEAALKGCPMHITQTELVEHHGDPLKVFNARAAALEAAYKKKHRSKSRS